MGILSSLFRNEQRAAPASQMMAYPTYDSGYSHSMAGLPVTEMGSLRNMAVFACVRIIGQSLASIPLILYERDGRSRRRATEHPLYPVLHDLGNSEMTAFELREARLAHALLYGNAYAEIEYDDNMQVIGLWPLAPDRVGIEREKGTGNLVYTYILDNGQGYVLPAWRVQHLRYMIIKGVTGISPIRQAMNAIGLADATEAFGSTYFRNGSRPSIILKVPGKMSPEAYQRLRTSFQETWSGLSNSHRINILEEGISPEAIGIPPEEAQFLATRKYQIAEIARLYGVPPHMLGESETATFASAEQDAINFRTNGLLPWARRDEQALQRDCLTPTERETYYIEYLLDGLERADVATRSTALNTMRQGGALTANEWRERENLDPVEGGDVLLQPLNMEAVGPGAHPDAESEPDPGDTEDDLPDGEEMVPGDAPDAMRSVFAPLFADAAKRTARRIAQDLRKAGGSALKRGGVEGFNGWLATFSDQLGPVVYETLLVPLRAQTLQAGGDLSAAEARLTAIVRQYATSVRTTGTELVAQEGDADGYLADVVNIAQDSDTWLADMAQRAALGEL